MPSHADYALTALALWREDRSGGNSGMTAVACVIRNRVNKNHSSYYAEVVQPWQFSSMTDPTDPQLAKYPALNDPNWTLAQLVAANVIDNVVSDITGGATLYYNPNGIAPTTKRFTLPSGQSIPFPQSWNEDVVIYTGTIGGHYFFREN